MYLFLSARGLCCLTRAISACGERGLLFVVVRGLLVVGASPCGGFSCCGAQALGRQTQQLRRMGSSAESVAAAQGRTAVPKHVECPQARDWARVPCIGTHQWWSLTHLFFAVNAQVQQQRGAFPLSLHRAPPWKCKAIGIPTRSRLPVLVIPEGLRVNKELSLGITLRPWDKIWN